MKKGELLHPEEQKEKQTEKAAEDPKAHITHLFSLKKKNAEESRA